MEEIVKEKGKRKRAIHYTKTIFYGDDFKEFIELFKKIIEKDKEILDTIPLSKMNVIKVNGMESWGIRYLIKNYVESNKVAFLKKYSN